MSSITYTTIKGVKYAYSSESFWDPVKKAARTRRKYLGKVDPETGEIIRVYKKSEKTEKVEKADKADEAADPILSEAILEEYERLKEEARQLKEQNAFLMDKLRLMKEVIDSIPSWDALDALS